MEDDDIENLDLDQLRQRVRRLERVSAQPLVIKQEKRDFGSFSEDINGDDDEVVFVSASACRKRPRISDCSLETIEILDDD